MVDDILDKIVVPDSKSTKGDVFKKEKEEKEEKHKEHKHKEKPKHHIYEKKEIFRKREFDRRRPVSFNIKQPGLIERGIYIAVILILFYFALFQNININFDFGDIFGGEVQPLVVKEKSETTEESEEIIIENEETTKEETELSGEITLIIDDVKTEKYDTDVSKITGFTFTIDNQKEEFDGKLLYYGYDGYTHPTWVTKPRGDQTYASIGIGDTSHTIDTTIVFTNTYTKTMRFELIDINNDETIANITKEVTIS